jgi:maltose/moltooligosaccharide transporter
MKEGFKKYTGITFLIGFGFFTMGMMEPLYDTYVPLLLKNYINADTFVNHTTLRGVIMAIDNILALFMIPLITGWSDKTRTKIGRRMPFIVLILPLAGIAFGFVPIAAYISLFVLILTIGVLNIFKQTAYGPVVALMPDSIPGKYRSEANGIINLMGGIAALIASGAGGFLMNMHVNLPGIGSRDKVLAFPLVGVLIIIATIILFVKVKEKHRAETEESPSILKSIKQIFTAKDKSILLILCGIFFWFLAYEGIKPFIGEFLEGDVKVPGGHEIFGMGAFIAAYIIFSIPAGYVGHKIGRKKTINISLLGCAIVMSLLFIVFKAFPAIYSMKIFAEIFFLIMMFIFGTFWVPVITNSFPMLWQMSTFTNVGIYTGLYYTFKQCASIIAPPMSGFVIDKMGYPGMFLFGTIFMVIALFIMRGVRQGEPDQEPPETAADLPG